MLCTRIRHCRYDPRTGASSVPLPTMATKPNVVKRKGYSLPVPNLATAIPPQNVSSAPLPTMATKPALTQTKSELFFPVHRSFSLNGQPQSRVRMPSAPTPCFPHDPALNASSVLCPVTQMGLNTKYRYSALGPMLRRCACAVPNRLPPPALPTFFSLQLSLEFLLSFSPHYGLHYYRNSE
ncbi:hypothetical protein C8R45DRAFT_1083933, partial [Mycena sanguinolenta]